MCGIEKSRFLNLTQTEEEELTCGICLGIFFDPIVTSCCQQTYCNHCIKQWLKTHNTCPNDKSDLNETGLMPACRVVTNILSKLKLSCDFVYDGCNEELTIESLKSHREKCAYNPKAKCDVCDTKIVDNGFHDCSMNLRTKIESLENSNNNLLSINDCLETKNQILNEENMNLVRENQEKIEEIERLKNMNGNVKQKFMELKNKIIPLLGDIEAEFDQKINEQKAEIHSLISNNHPKIKWSKLYLQVDRILSGVFVYYSVTRVVRQKRWRILCQITFDKSNNTKCFGFYLQCAENTENSWSCHVNAELSILSQKQGCDHFTRKYQFVCNNNKPNCGFKPFAPWNTIVNPNNGWIKNGSLNLEVVFSVF